MWHCIAVLMCVVCLDNNIKQSFICLLTLSFLFHQLLITFAY